jgi:enoyl-CoA hydratase/carnithine racemase
MAALSNDLVLRQDGDAIATLTLNRPERSNALSEGMMDALEERIHEVADDPAIRVIVLAANGKNFCAGHDLAEMHGHADKAYFETLFARCSRMMMAIRSCPKPVVARVRGAAVAAGCQLVATCDLAYAADTARFGVSGINLGLFCSTPSVALSRSVPRKQAMELLLTGEVIGAGRAAEIGLVNAALAEADLDAAVGEIARTIAAKIPDAISLGKDLFYRQIEMSLPEAYALAGERMAENISHSATKQRIGAFLRKD